VGGHAVSAANHLVFFHRQIDLGAAGLAQKRVEFRPHRLLRHFGQDIIAARGAAATALGRFLGFFDYIRDRLVGSISADIEVMVDSVTGEAHEAEPTHVELELFAADKLVDVDPGGSL
jgi:hypothetical protein